MSNGGIYHVVSKRIDDMRDVLIDANIYVVVAERLRVELQLVYAARQRPL